jgi:hypothetical protein
MVTTQPREGMGASLLAFYMEDEPYPPTCECGCGCGALAVIAEEVTKAFLCRECALRMDLLWTSCCARMAARN